MIGATFRVPSATGGSHPAWLMFCCFLLLIAGISSGAAREVEREFFDTTFGDFREELATAKEQGKRGILIMFEMEGCPFCQRMRNSVLNRPEVAAYYRKHFLIFPVDIEGALEVVDFSGTHLTQKSFAREVQRVRVTPTFAFFDLDGQLLASHSGATSDAAEFLLIGRSVVEGRDEDRPQQDKPEHRDTGAR